MSAFLFRDVLRPLAGFVLFAGAFLLLPSSSANAKSCYLSRLDRPALAREIGRQVNVPRAISRPQAWRWTNKESIVGTACPSCLKVGTKGDLLFLGETGGFSYLLADCGLIGLPVEQSLVFGQAASEPLEGLTRRRTIQGIIEQAQVETRPFVLRDKGGGLLFNLGRAPRLQALVGAEVRLSGRVLEGMLTVDMVGNLFEIESATWKTVQPRRSGQP